MPASGLLKETALKLYYSVWNQKQLYVIDEIFAPDFSIYASELVITDAKILKEFISAWFHAFPDIHHEVDDCVVQGEKLALRFHGKATHKGQFLDIAPTHKRIFYTGMNFMHFEKNTIKKLWLNSDMYELVNFLRK